MPSNSEDDSLFEDIRSSSIPKTAGGIKSASQNYGNGIFKNLDKVIKAISFIVAIGILLAFAIIAVIVAMLDKLFMIVAVGVFILGIILSALALFLIYALGHLISQNNEIIKKL